MINRSTAGPMFWARRAALVAAVLILVAGALFANGVSASPDSSARACTDLSGTSIPASAIGMPTSGGEVTAASLMPATGTGESARAEHCRVDAALHPVDPTAQDIRMRIALPTNWNGKAMMFGGGGYNGRIRNIFEWDQGQGRGYTAGPPLISRGYAIFSSDSGHQLDPGWEFDSEFARKNNEEELRNFGGDALKKTRDAAVFLMNAHYGEGPERTYFTGNSTGGSEALRVALRWPTDFDGVASWAPSPYATAHNLELGRLAKIFSQPGAWPNPARQKLVYDAVIDACDGMDGARDGIISYPDGCHFDPHTLRCPDGVDTGDTCLSDAQIAAFIEADTTEKVNYPLFGGVQAYQAYPLLSGADLLERNVILGTQPPANPMPSGASGLMQYWQAWVRDFVTKDPNYNSLTIDPQNPKRWKQRIMKLSSLGQDWGIESIPNNADFSSFAKSGGKLLMVQGTADPEDDYRDNVAYFNRMQAAMGPEAVQDFARLYLIPGHVHSLSARHAPFRPLWDWVSALDDWVETGEPPQNQTVVDTSPEGAGRSRPLCEYPTWPKFNGTGDMNQASSFTCVAKP